MVKLLAVILLFQIAAIFGNASKTFGKSPKYAEATDVDFYLYSPNGAFKSVICQNLTGDLEGNIYFITHGWIASAKKPWITKMAQLLLGKYTNGTVFSINWEKDANKDYIRAAASMRSVAKYIADFITCIGQNHQNFDRFLGNIQLMGHSLGAHLIGIVGQHFKGGKIGRISGFDPAGPLFTYPFLVEPDRRLSPDDGKLVDVIHTDSGRAGSSVSLGSIDFYPNGGAAPQPPCVEKNEKDLDTCSHEISHVYYSKTIPDPTIYLATQCLVLEKNLFFSIYSYNESCKDGKKAYMGDKITKNAQGDFHLVIKTVAYEQLDIE